MTAAEERSIQADFEKFHALNPWVYATLLELTRDMVGRGHHRLGINMLWEVLRWQYLRTTVDPASTFKLNDHYPSRYVRLLLAEQPELSGVFVLRGLRAP